MSATRVIAPGDGEWPARLVDLDGLCPPRELYLRGLPLDGEPKAVAIVGTRRPTDTGIEVATRMARDVAEAGMIVVSGMAMGIDTVAHRAALAAGGTTIAVMGCGLDRDYPSGNRAVRAGIERAGTLVSEYPDGTAPDAWRFPERNRIIAALADAVVVIEGGSKSGALITARHGLDANRHVFAVPGSVRNAMAIAPNELIRTSRAALATSTKDVFEAIAPELVWTETYAPRPVAAPSIAPDEAAVLALLDDAPVAEDRLSRRVDMKPGQLALVLSKLEIRGLAASRTAGYFITEAGARVGEHVTAAQAVADHIDEP